MDSMSVVAKVNAVAQIDSAIAAAEKRGRILGLREAKEMIRLRKAMYWIEDRARKLESEVPQ